MADSSDASACSATPHLDELTKNLERLDDALGLDKENMDPEKASRVRRRAKACTKKIEPVKEESKNWSERFKKIEKDIEALKESQRVMAGPALRIGLGQLRYDLLKKLREYPELESGKKLPKESTGPGEKSQQTKFSECTRLDSWAESLRKTSQGQPYKDHLAKRGLLEELKTYYNFIQDSDLRKVRNKVAHETQWKTFAYAVVKGAEQNDPECMKIFSEFENAFEFTYDETWLGAANSAKEEHTPIEYKSV